MTSVNELNAVIRERERIEKQAIKYKKRKLGSGIGDYILFSDLLKIINNHE